MENQESEVIPVVTQPVVTQPVEQQKVKNPKRIEAGKKGAAARKAKRLLQDVTNQNAANQITKITIGEEEPEKIKINVYKNYIPPCLVLLGIAGLGLYIYSKKSATQPVAVQPVHVAPKDPFDF